jgi:hypothetical protein
MTAALDLSAADRAPATAARMAAAAQAFLASLNDAQRAVATIPFGDDRRYVWDYRPLEDTPRNGLRLINMTAAQQRLALALLDIGLSTRGAQEVRQIIDLEVPLLLQEKLDGRVTPYVRHPEQYAVCVIGDPARRDPWAWHVGGHHLGLHFTIVDGDRLAAVPLFFGANPAEVRHGPLAGQRTLAEEEDLARSILHSLAPAQRQLAVVSPVAYPDLLTDHWRVAYPYVLPRGLSFGAMDGEARTLLVRLLRHYVERTNPELSEPYWRRVEAELDDVTFAWTGGDQRGQGHYYAIKAPSYLVEYDNTQNGANHIHSVWRDLAGDWGEDLLAQHYAAAHRLGPGAPSDSGSA